MKNYKTQIDTLNEEAKNWFEKFGTDSFLTSLEYVKPELMEMEIESDLDELAEFIYIANKKTRDWLEGQNWENDEDYTPYDFFVALGLEEGW
jgi:hypothetical protein